MVAAAADSEGPLQLADALKVIQKSGLLSGPDGSHARPLTPDPASALAEFWSDSPIRVVDRTDVLNLSEVVWDEPRVLKVVREIAALANVPCDSIVVADSPEQFADWAEDSPAWQDPWDSYPPPWDGWMRYFGALCSGQHEHWKVALAIIEQSGRTDSVRVRPGRTLWAHSWAEMLGQSLMLSEKVALSSVTRFVTAYVGLMYRHGAALDAYHWRPPPEISEEFGIELRIGQLLVEAYCAGLGYIAPVEAGIAIARRPALRLLDTPSRVGDQPRFHHDAGPAIEFADGTGDHFLYGTPLGAWLHRAIVDGALTMRYVRDMPWQDIRMAAYPAMPPDAFLDGLDAQLVDVGSKNTRLYRIDAMPDHHGPAWYMVMTDPSTDRTYGEFVPPAVGMVGSADVAQAAAWGIAVEDYRRMTLEG